MQTTRIIANLRSEALIAGEWKKIGQATHDQIYTALGLNPNRHLPPEGVPRTLVVNVWVWIIPKTLAPQDATRTWCECPTCGRHLTAGKFQQHFQRHSREARAVSPKDARGE